MSSATSSSSSCRRAARRCEQFETFGVVESVKAVSDLFSPVSGEVVEVNEALRDAPELLNSDPFGEGWILKVELADAAELDVLMDAARTRTRPPEAATR